MWSRFLLILCLIHSIIARPQGQVDTPPSFFSDNQLGQTSGTPQFIAPGDTSSDSNLAIQQAPWTEDPEPILLAGSGCNGPHSRPRRSFTKREGGFCSPTDRFQSPKQQAVEGQQPRPGPAMMTTPPEGVDPGAAAMWNTIYSLPGKDGKPDDRVCATSGNPLLRVPICAWPQPISPASFVLPARFCTLLFFSSSRVSSRIHPVKD